VATTEGTGAVRDITAEDQGPVAPGDDLHRVPGGDVGGRRHSIGSTTRPSWSRFRTKPLPLRLAFISSLPRVVLLDLGPGPTQLASPPCVRHRHFSCPSSLKRRTLLERASLAAKCAGLLTRFVSLIWSLPVTIRVCQ
jgi:hypothetical protein